MKLIPKNWNTFQHYRNRCPPWIKLHRELLNDKEFMCLPLASKAIAPLLWLLASESKNGEFDASIDELSFRLRISNKEVEQGLNPLINNGFFIDASTMLAPCLQLAIPETEREGERETKKKVFSDDKFDAFWIAYPKKVAKEDAISAWRKIKLDDILFTKMLKAIKDQKLSETEKKFIPNPATWLNAKRWEDEVSGTTQKPLMGWK
jgi:hypothetical protein